MTSTDGYISIDFNGEKLGIKFGMLASEWLSKKYREDPSLVEVDGTPSLVGVAWLIYYGYSNNCQHKDIQEVYTPGNFLEWVEDRCIEPDNNVLEQIGICYRDSRYTNAWLERSQKQTEEVKKKVMNGNTFNPSVSENLV